MSLAASAVDDLSKSHIMCAYIGMHGHIQHLYCVGESTIMLTYEHILCNLNILSTVAFNFQNMMSLIVLSSVYDLIMEIGTLLYTFVFFLCYHKFHFNMHVHNLKNFYEIHGHIWIWLYNPLTNI